MFAFGFRGNPISALAACTLVCGLAGCTLSPFDDDGAVRQISRSVKLSPQATEAPGFVEQSRGRELEFLPVGVTPAARTPLKDAKQLEAELQTKRQQNEAAAAAARPPSPYDGKIEPGYKPPPAAPVPPSGPNVAAPKAPPPASAAASPRDRAIAGARKRAQEAAEQARP